jgi:outer membrane protein TolC
LGLQECLQIAHDQQPALLAERATLASANTQYDALQRIHTLGIIVGRDLALRRTQSCLGIRIAEAGLDQAEWETTYAVTRTYYGVIFARHQQRVAKAVAESLKFYQERVSELVKKGDRRDLTTNSLDKITLYLRLAETRQAEATRGIERATSALREAMGVSLDFPLRVPEEPLRRVNISANRDEIVALALARRGELTQASTVAEVVELEAKAQDKSFMPVARTFAAVSDIHARPIPQGISNGEYRPGATGIDMPTALAGPRSSRVDRARDLGARADAVVTKTHNLIALEAADAFLKWEEADRKIPQTKDAAEAGARLSENTRKDFIAGQKVGIDEILTTEVLAGQAQASYNEAVYQQLLALAGLQRVTAGGFDPGLLPH